MDNGTWVLVGSSYKSRFNCDIIALSVSLDAEGDSMKLRNDLVGPARLDNHYFGISRGIGSLGLRSCRISSIRNCTRDLVMSASVYI